MRPDVKLGVMLAFVMVIVAGGYYMYRDRHESPIPLSGSPANLAQDQSDQPPAQAKARQRKRSPTPSKPFLTKQAKGKGKRDQRPADKRSTSTAGGRKAAADSNVATNRRPAKPGDRAQAPSGVTTATAPATHRTPEKHAATGSPKLPNEAGPASRSADARQRKPQHRKPKQSAELKARTSRASASKASRAADPQASSVAVETHRVQPGDTFSLLAKTYYGHEKYTQYLMDYNKHVRKPTALRVGVSVKIPPLPADVATIPARPTKVSDTARPASSRDRPRRYTVRPGDSFYAIAKKELGDASRWKELLKLNSAVVGGDPKHLQVGQVLTLPRG